MAEIRYLTMDGQPPNGGMPPNMGDFPQVQPPPFPVPVFPMVLPGPTPQPPPLQAPLQAFFGPALFSPVPAPDMFHFQPQQAQQFSMQVPVAQAAATPPAALVAPVPFPVPVPAAPVTPAAPSGPSFQNPHGGNIPGTDDQPLVLSGGHGYLFPPKNTTIHLFRCTTYYPWDSQDGIIEFVTYQAPTNMTVADLIRQVCPQGDDIKGRGVVECQQAVNGGATVFTRGEEYFIGEGKGEAQAMKDRVGKTLAQVGWNEHRKANANPVWLASSISFY
ncbi:uncharacterized protein BDCG_03083 [Blastomyces dermatitidis ER-3]|uniref:Uncharacterized protein n=1 Tax=Ajellomyces dermatitidis (strain ER-3 / ATCC MYA-2586) TaxID=559297 RepID=A0ABP2EVG6_AJEDR|nr:uncharacterized protein BDCG_03083 [Blastomyces dermatitidis ER-3]EEQ87963.1 hypothetical protein BDCG_03083 [Blastomyces dermatitidis ER-3]